MRILFLDRDGTLIREPEDYQVDAFEKIEFYPKVFQFLGRIARETDFALVMVTNQDGLGTAAHPEDRFWPPHDFVMKAFANEGIHFKEVLIDRTYPHEHAPTRKPATGLLTHYLNGDFDLAGSWVIGDRLTDMALAKNLGCRGIWLNNEPELGAAEVSQGADGLSDVIQLITTDWEEVFKFLKIPDRKAELRRKTRETDVFIRLNLDGTGQSDIRTGLGFFDHMLDQLAKHGGVDLEVRVSGDLGIDEHHTIEDTALALGQAFRAALGDKMGLERYGFHLPMDDCLAQVAVDFGGRPWLVWDAAFKREKIGDMPTEMFFHFFKSFTDEARCNLNIKVEGENEHHKIESVFKAFARAIRKAVKRDPDNMQLPSTKGTL
ncbi:MAG TPA: bifunctional histidinol-phosphatase/imidazoleglycerol-phosphate dehydratase HisB [Flavilitoribacter sp.]|nr:bifunctional histidinol-phosphatase/imidazoleglycerol-phosphate dehydratase HisB [Flavilitoribacter sp.]HMQ85947.1 bifunctional histidinol-phosphatase/imidazoleglycerol-phosphate dehydratase HisB [Flavilitoribacter sp.]